MEFPFKEQLNIDCQNVGSQSSFHDNVFFGMRPYRHIEIHKVPFGNEGWQTKPSRLKKHAKACTLQSSPDAQGVHYFG